MHLPAPNLDDRRFQDLVDEAKRHIPRLCPDWTDHNVSDPGITLIELFAWMTEQYIFRLNQVPDKNMLVFLDLIGARLQPAQPAKGDITFTLSAAPTAERRAIIPKWTEVATERTEMQEAVVFTTDLEVEVIPPTPCWFLTSADSEDYKDRSLVFTENSPTDVWETPPHAPQAFYIGFVQDLSAHTLVIRFQCDKVGIGIDPNKPPWVWEVWRGSEFKWEPIEVTSDRDSTAGLNQDGEVKLYLPYRVQPSRLLSREAGTWLRCSPNDHLPPGEAPYARSPRIRRASAYTIGITVPITHALPVGPEVLGISNGQPGQKLRLLHSSVLKPEGPEEIIQVSTEDGGWETWQPVHDFGSSSSADKHYVFDPVTSEVEFGPAIRQRDGTEPQFGAIPTVNHTIRMLRYRVGGGVRGNVAEGRVKVLKTTLPYVQSVVNRDPITGGLEAQDIEDAKLRAPALLRTRFRAVTSEDYEFLSKEIEGVGRVRCLQPRPDDPEAPPPGTVRLLVIPNLAPLEGAELDRDIDLHEAITHENRRLAVENELQEQLRLPPTTEVRLRDYLDARRLLTSRLDIRQPQYVWVTVQTRVRPLPKAEPERVRRDVKVALYRFLHPLYGGPDGAGWPFGRALTIDKVYALIQTVPGVEYATELDLYPINLADQRGQRLGKSEQVIGLPSNGVIVSYYHNVYLAR